jgi:hypothetical protein
VRGAVQRAVDHLHDFICAKKNVVVPKSQDLVAGCFQFGRAPGVILDLVLMLAAVNFDYELSIQADEVDDVRSQRVLSSKFVLFQVPVPQELP